MQGGKSPSNRQPRVRERCPASDTWCGSRIPVPNCPESKRRTGFHPRLAGDRTMGDLIGDVGSFFISAILVACILVAGLFFCLADPSLGDASHGRDDFLNRRMHSRIKSFDTRGLMCLAKQRRPRVSAGLSPGYYIWKIEGIGGYLAPHNHIPDVVKKSNCLSRETHVQLVFQERKARHAGRTRGVAAWTWAPALLLRLNRANLRDLS